MTTDHGPVMQKSINDIAKYLKNLIPAKLAENYPLKPMFKNIASENDIREGVVAFRDFLYLFCDYLSLEGHLFFKLKKNPKNATDYPFLYSITDLLADIGYHSELADGNESLVISDLPSFTGIIDKNGKRKKPKNSTSMLLTCLHFLKHTGFVFTGVNLEGKRIDLEEVKSLEVSYPKDPFLLTGLKVMSIADVELREKRYKSDYKHDNLLRCEYRLLEANDNNVLNSLRDFLSPLSKNVQDFALELHHYYTEIGMTCVKIVTTFEIHFAYSYITNSRKKLSSREIYQKRIWEFAVSPRNGFCIVLRPKKVDKYSDVIEKFSLPLQKRIKKGYGCDRKLYNEPCQGGCEGIRFSLDDATLNISNDIKIWLDQEVSFKLVN
jgi:hypothetical protein